MFYHLRQSSQKRSPEQRVGTANNRTPSPRSMLSDYERARAKRDRPDKSTDGARPKAKPKSQPKGVPKPKPKATGKAGAKAKASA